MKPQWQHGRMCTARRASGFNSRGLIFFKRKYQMKIASMEDPFPHGTVIGKQITRRPLSEAENYFRCDKCGWFDARDLGWVEGSRRAVATSGI
jgi:hypothetical protein